jgi:hypothetical protein
MASVELFAPNGPLGLWEELLLNPVGETLIWWDDESNHTSDRPNGPSLQGSKSEELVEDESIHDSGLFDDPFWRDSKSKRH